MHYKPMFIALCIQTFGLRAIADDIRVSWIHWFIIDAVRTLLNIVLIVIEFKL